MDFHLKQWRNHQQQQEDESDQPSVKSPRQLDHYDPPHPNHHHHQHQYQHQQHSCGTGSGSVSGCGSPALPLFVSEQLSTKLSAFPTSAHSTPTPASRFPMGMGTLGSYFSLGQRHELELQALIFRHMIAGAAVPPELLHLVKNSLLNNNNNNNTTTHSPYNNYLQHSLQQYYPHYQPALLQSGYWGRGAMDPEPGRCRRTDGKKWRCSRDVVAGHKYCERHMHRGRNRSRKPVEIPTPTTTTSGGANGGSGGGALLKSNNSFAAHPLTSMSDGSHFALSGTRPPIDLLHFNQRLSDPKIENKCIFEPHSGRVSGDDKSGDRILRHFFDDWPKSDNTGSSSSPVASATSLSISTPRDPPSDFSLTLSTGNGDDDPSRLDGVVERERLQRHWAVAGWGTNQVAPMGGPLAEALRSSTSSSSPTSVLHQLQRGPISRTSYVST